MIRAGLAGAMLVLSAVAQAQSGGSFRIDAIINGQSQICIGATNIQYALQQLRITWRCGSTTFACFNTATINVLPSQQRLYVTCSSTPPVQDSLFASSFE